MMLKVRRSQPDGSASATSTGVIAPGVVVTGTSTCVDCVASCLYSTTSTPEKAFCWLVTQTKAGDQRWAGMTPPQPSSMFVTSTGRGLFFGADCAGDDGWARAGTPTARSTTAAASGRERAAGIRRCTARIL